MELENLKTKFLGRNLYYYKTIDSTQLEVWRKINSKTIEDGAIIISEKQTNAKRNTWKEMVHRRTRQHCIFICNKIKL